MFECFCFKPRRSRRRISTRSAKLNIPVELPPPVIGRVPSSTVSDESLYLLATRGKNTDLQRILCASSMEEKSRRLTWTDESGRSALIAAVKEGHTECINTLLKYGADVLQMSYGKDEGTALHIAVRKKLPLKVVYSLLSKGANPFLENHSNYTAWDFAQMYTNWPVTCIFKNLGLYRRNLPVQVGSNPNTIAMRDVCIFPRYEWHKSSTLRRTRRTIHVSSIGPDEEHSDFDLTGVQSEWLAGDLSPEIVSILLTFPKSKVRLAKELATHCKGTAPVLLLWIPKWASWTLHEFLNIVELTDYGSYSSQSIEEEEEVVEDRITQWLGEQATSQASINSDDFIVGNTLCDEVYKYAAAGDSKELKYLLNSLSSIDKMRTLCWEDAEERTPLMIAAQKGYGKCVKMLLEHGANVHFNSRGQHAGTALHTAIASTVSQSIIDCLLSYNANPLMENYVRVTPADLSEGDKSLLLNELLLFNEIMNGSVTLKGQNGTIVSNKDFQVIVAPRYACCDRPQDFCRISKTLHLYEAEKNTPILEIDLYEANAQILPERAESFTDLAIIFSSASVKRWNWTGTPRPEADSTIQVWMSYGKTYSRFSELVNVINARTGMHIRPSVKNLWKASKSEKDLAHSEKSNLTSAHESSSSAAPYVTNEDLRDSLGYETEHVKPESGRVCMICLDKPVTTAFVHQNKMHECACKECAVDLMQAENGRCPFCRKSIDTIISI